MKLKSASFLRFALFFAATLFSIPAFSAEQVASQKADPKSENGSEVQPSKNSYAEILVIDKQTGRGVPMVELETVNSMRFVTDSAGRIAFDEPGLIGRELFFHVRSHGYEADKDGFGIAGVR